MAGSLKPQMLTPTDWYYECPTHLLLVHEVRLAGRHLRTDSIKIPWRKIVVSAKRSYKPRKKPAA